MVLTTTALFVSLLVSCCSAQDTVSYGTVVDIAVGSPVHTTLVAAVQAAGLVETLSTQGPFTVFAPTNDAFAALGDATLTKYLEPQWNSHLQDILLYHVTPGSVPSCSLVLNQAVGMANGENATISSLQPPMINDANIVTADLYAGNGIVHVIDKVLLPFSATHNVVTAAVALPDIFSTLVDLVTSAGLVETLQGPGPFTVFAPTNDAFAALDPATVEYLVGNTDALVDILLYHVYPGIVLQQDVQDGTVLDMANNETTTITVTALSTLDAVMTKSNVTVVDAAVQGELEYFINDAKIVGADVLVNNGVIHIIDSVLSYDAVVRKVRRN